MSNLQRLKSYLNKLYGEFDFRELFELLEKYPEADGENTDWYKTFNLYVTYPDSFKDNGNRDLSTLTKQLERIKATGFNAIHVLPFMDSPLIDAGFDIRDFKKVREDLGGNKAFDEFLKEAKKLDMKVFIDIILNHISNQHEWFQKAVNGDETYRKYFYAFEKKPVLMSLRQGRGGYIAKYAINDDIKEMRLIFPELAQELPHFYEGQDGYYYFHTFYPEQPDLNWGNPRLFIEMAKLLIYWTEKGVNFRLDAIPFIGKSFELAIFESSPIAHEIIRALNIIISRVNPSSIFLSEAYQPIEKVLQYFGDSQGIESKMAYDFKLMNILWECLLIEDFKKLRAYLKLRRNLPIPKFSQWIIFLRNHDELSLEFADEYARKIILDRLSFYGMEFRKGYGVSGRTASFLGNEGAVLAYGLLCSLPGCPALVYGDEIGKKNDLGSLMVSKNRKKKLLGKAVVDSRDINRGFIEESAFKKKNAIEMERLIATIFNAKLKFPQTYTTNPTIVKTAQKGVLYLRYKLEGEKELHCIVNLGKDAYKFEFDYSEVVLSINNVNITDKNIEMNRYSIIWLVK